MGILLLVSNKLNVCTSTQGVKARPSIGEVDVGVGDGHLPASGVTHREASRCRRSHVAAQRTDELFNEGDLDGAAAWRRILHAVDELQRVTLKVARE